ncbi:hypothetical protein LINPERHAP1_LOCUS18847 [Linum perenne]
MVQHLKSSACLSGLTKEALLLILQCVRYSKSATTTRVVTIVQNAKCLKTSSGYTCPVESFLCDTEWGCLLRVFRCSPIIENEFYGNDEIISYKEELRKLGVKVDHVDAIQAFLSTFKQQVFVSKITKEHVLSFLSCYRRLKELDKPIRDIRKCIRSEKWLRTRLGDYRSPNDCILFGPDWKYLRAITCLPFLDDSGNGYGMGIHEYAAELKTMGMVSGLEDGAKAPKDCCLFNSSWGTDLKNTDGPFIDESFYGPKISSYEKELNKIGVRIGATELPAVSGSGEIVMCDKRDVFIADDLVLKHCFSEYPIFVWYPQPSLPYLSRTKLLEVYRGIGVRGISESVQKEENSLEGGNQVLKQVKPEKIFMGKELAKIILGFLADPCLEMEKLERDSGSRSVTELEYACRFSEVIAKGVLWEKEDNVTIAALSGIIRLAFLLNFDEAAVDFLMKANNLQIFLEDEEFLSKAFPSS